MSTDLNASFNEQFMNINTKLKKRFLRKPNVSEATNEFIALAIQCEYSEQPAFAAHAYVGAAKCEASVGDFLGEAENLLAAARHFMRAERKLRALKFCSPDRENLEAAIGCFMQAFSKYPEGCSIRLSILTELAGDLAELGLAREAAEYYQQALALVTEPNMKIMFTRNYINLLIDCGKYDIALEKANELVDTNQNLPEDIFAEIQLSRVLLALQVEPPDDAKNASTKRLLAAVLSDAEGDELPFNASLRLKLQSTIAASGAHDAPARAALAVDLRRLVAAPQAALLARGAGRLTGNGGALSLQ